MQTTSISSKRWGIATFSSETSLRQNTATPPPLVKRSCLKTINPVGAIALFGTVESKHVSVTHNTRRLWLDIKWWSSGSLLFILRALTTAQLESLQLSATLCWLLRWLVVGLTDPGHCWDDPAGGNECCCCCCSWGRGCHSAALTFRMFRTLSRSSVNEPFDASWFETTSTSRLSTMSCRCDARRCANNLRWQRNS